MDNYLMHYGVKGMRWGVITRQPNRNDPRTKITNKYVIRSEQYAQEKARAEGLRKAAKATKNPISKISKRVEAFRNDAYAAMDKSLMRHTEKRMAKKFGSKYATSVRKETKTHVNNYVKKHSTVEYGRFVANRTWITTGSAMAGAYAGRAVGTLIGGPAVGYIAGRVAGVAAGAGIGYIAYTNKKGYRKTGYLD